MRTTTIANRAIRLLCSWRWSLHTFCTALVLGTGCAELERETAPFLVSTPVVPLPAALAPPPGSVAADDGSSDVLTLVAAPAASETGSGNKGDGQASSSQSTAGAAADQLEALPIDLATALRLANVNNPTIALAQQRVQEEIYRYEQAKVLWLPDLWSQVTYQQHNGILQTSRGDMPIVDKWNFYNGGAAFFRWDAADVIFEPLIARKLVKAQGAAAQATAYGIQLDVALTYQDLLRVYGELAINADTQSRAEEMLRNAEAAEEAGLGTSPADITRARMEVNLIREQNFGLEMQATGTVSARLARLLLLQPTVELRPVERQVVPVTLVPEMCSLDDLVATGLLNRPELRESRALVEAAIARWKKAKSGPFLPEIDVGYNAGLYGGQGNEFPQRFGGRGDGLAQALWRLNNLGAGDVANIRVRKTQVGEAYFRVIEQQAAVAEQVVSAAKVAQFQRQSLTSAQDAVRQALETWRRLREASFGLAAPGRRYEPLGPLIAERDLDRARRLYLTAVVEYNKAQFRLYWALGQPPACALPGTAEPPVQVPTVPEKPGATPSPEGDKDKAPTERGNG